MKARVASILALLAAMILLTSASQGHAPVPPPSFEGMAFIPFPTPSPAPTFAGHSYAVLSSPAAPSPAPTASPRPQRPKATSSAAGHTSSGSGARTIRGTKPRHRDNELTGKASWHATGRSGYYAAACRPLRRAIGPDWRGRHVLVSNGRKAVELVLNDWCGSHDKTIDLSDEMFSYFAPLSRGVIRVTVGW